MTTELQCIFFLLEAEAEWRAARDEALAAEAARKPDDDTIEAARDLPPYITNFIGSKQKLVDWIWVHTPEGVKSVLDAFSGSAVVGYMFKTKGLQVIANDRLRYCFNIARAIIENNSVTLSDDEIEGLLNQNSKSVSPASARPGFVQETFRGKFFQTGVHAIIDTIRANIDDLKGYKKNIALFALGKTCISGAGSYGHFASTSRGRGERRADTPKEFVERFRNSCTRINALIFDNGRENKAFNKEVLEVLPEVEVDLAYFDPPYATEFSTTNYETSYHFVEGLMTYWKGLEIDETSRVKKFHSDHRTVTESNAEEFFDGFLSAAKGIKYWIISYRDHAYPNEAKMKALIEKHGRASRMTSKDHAYQMAGQNRGGEASHAREHLFICEPKSSAKAEMEIEPFTTVADLFLEAGKDSDVRVTAFMGSKHDMLEWIWKYTPDGVESVLDLFSGGANVAYFYKRKGMRVIANDLLDYPYHIARAVIENSSVTLSDEEIEALLEPNSKAKDFIVRTFYGYYYTKPILEFLDNSYANIQQLKGYRKNIALFALGRACLIRACFGEFSRSKKSLTEPIPDDANKYPTTHIGNPPLSEFKELFVKCIKDANELVFDNGQECKAYRQDALSLLPKIDVDLVYADPPYMTQFGFNDYEDKMHFVEGLMTCWEGKEILDNDRRNFVSCTKYNRDSITELIQGFVDGTAHIGAYLMMSYRDKAYPTAAELKEMFRERYDEVDFRRRSVSYGIARYAGEGSGRDAQEYLVIASKPKALKAAAADKSDLAPIDTKWSWDWTKDADAIIEKFGWKGLAEACAYVDLDYDAKEKEDGKWSQAKAAYHLPYRKLVDGKLLVVWRGLVAAMAALNGARGGVKLPKAAKEKAWKVLARWYKEFDREPPPLASQSDDVARACHTSLTGEIISADELSAFAEPADVDGSDKHFTFILAHAGTNLNGDHFTEAEMKARYASAVNTKIDLKHSQDLTDIVGGVADARFVEADGGYIECDGELYTEDNPFARLAYKLIKKGIVRQVSMECDYEEGECSICGKRIRSKNDYCLHLKKHKGREYQGKAVFEILHNITFTGMALLDRKGADPEARIISVANSPIKERDRFMETIADFGSYLEARKINEEIWPLTSALEGYISDLLKKFAADEISKEDLTARITSGLDMFRSKMKGLVDQVKIDASTKASAATEEDLKKLRQENEELKKQLEELQKKVEAYEAEKRKAERSAKATKLVEDWEKRGRKFKDEAERTAEIERLAGLDDSAFEATKSVIDALPEAKADEGDPDKGNGKKVLRSDAGIDPAVVDDKTDGLADRLTKGLREVREAQST